LVLLTLPFAYSWLKRGAPHGTIKHLIGFDSLVIFVPLIFVPTLDNTGIYWIFGYPMIVFFFLGVRTGFQWILIYCLILLAGIGLAHQGLLKLYHTPMQIGLAFAEIIIFTAIGYFFVSDREGAEKQQALHLHYLESVDRIERALHADLDPERSMEHALQCLLEVFACSRAWMLSPVHPDATSYQVQFEKHAPDFPGALAAGAELESNEMSRQMFLDALASKQPVCYDNRHPLPGTPEIAERFSIRSRMVIALNRDSETAWMLGIHQCDRERQWSSDEQRLFQDIANRMEDALNQTLLYRELTTSEKNLRQAIKQAEAASHAKSEFLSVMSHELRTPLHGIIGLQNLIAADTDGLSREQRENLVLAQQSAKSLRALVNDVLDLAKIESGTMELVQDQFELFDCIRDALVPFILPAREKGIDLSLEMHDVPATIIGDESRLRQVLLNLIGNAAKFTDHGEISVHVSHEHGQLHVAVKDSGIGIPAESIQTIFEPFTQAAVSRLSQQKGSGLGTSITKRFVELMHGTIQVESVVGQGSCFTFQIPCHPVGKKRISRTIHATQNDLNIMDSSNIPNARPGPGRSFKLTALLAEDDPIGQRIAVKQLSRAGIDVDAVDNGKSAWEKVQNRRYDLLLTDIRMPGMSGIELTQKIRRLEKETGSPHLPIIGLSAHALDDVAKACIKAGMDHFMTKPVDPESILSAVAGSMSD